MKNESGSSSREILNMALNQNHGLTSNLLVGWLADAAGCTARLNRGSSIASPALRALRYLHAVSMCLGHVLMHRTVADQSLHLAPSLLAAAASREQLKNEKKETRSVFVAEEKQ